MKPFSAVYQMISAYIRHISNCLTMWQLTGARTTENLENL
jgi:hypothetical protein